ncbi:hypothetical protein [Streptomyces mangrovisoli]|uniref:Uncharacterized protein n=1 Tax=Streptomyces mangrovisoli TaxID=1428628 RepID=A0A1J4P046_9ACTN|nr:hypothetical protein [Streptomyces mangrovisoli]OIJ66790.1 hypothetical protein WN71_016610 [Streptomyces mangrovisoli]
MFVDTSGRRSKVLRRIGLLVGTVCLGYTAVLAMAFMGWGTSLDPSSLLPFDSGQSAQRPGFGQQGGLGRQAGRPTATPSATSGSSSTSVTGSSSTAASGSSAAATAG